MKNWLWLIVFFGLRLLFIGLFPVFNDEAIYAQWTQAVVEGGTAGLTPMLMDGKQPGMLLLWAPFEAVLGRAWPFGALRLVNMLLGLATALLVFWLYKLISGKNMLWWQKIIYVAIPGLVWYESLGLQEAGVMLCATGLVAFGWWLMTRRQFTLADAAGTGGFFGLLIGISWWIKPSVFSVGLVFGYVYWQMRKRKVSWSWLWLHWLVAAGVGLLIISVMWLHSFGVDFFQASNGRLLASASLWWGRLYRNIVWLFWWSGGLLVFALLAASKRKDWFLFWLLVGGLLLPLFAGVGIYASRYVIGVLPVVMLYGLIRLQQQQLGLKTMVVGASFLVTIGLTMWPQFVYKMTVIFPAVHEDLSQYMEGWPSGFGVKQAISFIKKNYSTKRKIVVVRRDSGNPESAVIASFWKDSNTYLMYESQYVLLQQNGQMEDLTIPVLFVSRDDHMGELKNTPMEELMRFERGLDSGHVGVWRLL